MNETLRNYLERVRQFFLKLSPQKKLLLALSGVLIVVSGGIFLSMVNHNPYEIVFSELKADELRAITKKLSELNIPFQWNDRDGTVLVPKTKVHDTRMALAQDGLPGQDVVGFEKFDTTSLGMSSYVQKIQYVRAISGELTRSIQRISSIKNARVHLSIPPKKTFMEEEVPPKASIVLELKAGKKLSRGEINGIAHLVASAVEGLSVDQVTIVDNQGQFLHRPEDRENQGLSHSVLEFKRSIETEYEKRIEELLVPVVGLDKVQAKATVEIDPSQIQSTEETFDPDKAVARTAIKSDESSQGSRPNPVGIPGSRSNLPGSEVQTPPIPQSNYSTEKNNQNLNYSIPRKILQINKPGGNIKRLTVSVVVDGYYSKDSKGQEVFTPRDENELKRLQEIVANAVGFDPERRDSLTVSSLPFKNTDMTPVADEVPKAFNWQELMNQGVKNLFILLVILLFFFGVLRPFLRWATLTDMQTELLSYPTTIQELEKARKDEGILNLSKSIPLIQDKQPIEKIEEEELRKKVEEKLGQLPKKGFRIVQEWLEDELIKNPVR